MFTRSDAEKLRLSLPPMQFFPTAGPARPSIRDSFSFNSAIKETAPTNNSLTKSELLLQQYRDFYSFDFISNSQFSHSAGLVESSEFTIVAQYFCDSGSNQIGTAFLLHGLFDHTGIYGRLIEHCLSQGYGVVIFDMPGHGLSSGEPASIDSFLCYVQAFVAVVEKAKKQALPQPWITLGQSTGASVLIDSILSDSMIASIGFRKIILLGPLLRPYLWNRSRIIFTFSRMFFKSTLRKFSENSHDVDFLQFIRHQDPLQPKRIPRSWVFAMMDFQKRFAVAAKSDLELNIIQGDEDKTVDWKFNLQRLQIKFPNSNSKIVREGRHHLVNESLEIRQMVFDMISAIVQGSE